MGDRYDDKAEQVLTMTAEEADEAGFHQNALWLKRKVATALRQAAADEREAVVEWLRKESHDTRVADIAQWANSFATRIELEAHHIRARGKEPSNG